MRWPFTHYGTQTLFTFTGIFILLMLFAGNFGRPLGSILSFIGVMGFILVVWFFRDPERFAQGGENELISPADGMVADIVTLFDPDLEEEVLRVGIFLSVTDVHVNRAPCSGKVTKVTRRPGQCHDARDSRTPDENEAVTLVLEREDNRQIGVRQLTGSIARRILCPRSEGDRLSRGERYGMIRFGSRTELLVPHTALETTLVRVGEKVRGGETLLVTLKDSREESPTS
ncbi:MAG: phosphatidylserine decarboxylase [Planctomycetota bacterium]|nr:phosphatidylserine decarboxylase [Planctomycetota bacterium]